MRTLKMTLVWLLYLAICTVLLFAFTLAPLPALALYFIGYLLVRYLIIPRYFPEPPEEPEDETSKE